MTRPIVTLCGKEINIISFGSKKMFSDGLNPSEIKVILAKSNLELTFKTEFATEIKNQNKPNLNLNLN